MTHRLQYPEHRRGRPTHRASLSPEYRSWNCMRQRCYNPKNDRYKDYGGRGIRVCRRWLYSFAAFLADMGPRPPGTSLERKKNHLNYCPSNCVWATPQEQQRNTRRRKRYTFAGETMTLVEWSEKKKIPLDVLRCRVGKQKWTIAEALNAPVQNRGLPAEEKRQRRLARLAVGRALRRGTLRRPSQCSHPGCRRSDVQAHHHRGYAVKYRLDVKWVCPTHQHRGLPAGT